MEIKINYKEDFKVLVTLPLIVSASKSPCKVVLHSGGARYVALFDGEVYTNAERVDDNHLLVYVSKHSLRTGDLEAEIFMALDDKSMPDKKYVLASRQRVKASKDGEEGFIVLVDGEPDRFDSSEFVVELIAPVISGSLSAELLNELKRLRDLGISIDTTNDVLRIGGKAYKLTPHREVLRTEVTFTNPTVSLSYGTIANAGGSASPTLTVTQKKVTTTYYTDGGQTSSETAADVTNKTVSYTMVSGEATLNASTGVVTYSSANSATSVVTRAVIKVSVTVNGKTATSANVDVKQAATSEPLGYYGYNSSKSYPTTDDMVKAGTPIKTSSLSVDFSASPLAGSTGAWVAVKKGKTLSIKDSDGDNQLNNTAITTSYDIRYYTGRGFSTKINIVIS